MPTVIGFNINDGLVEVRYNSLANLWYAYDRMQCDCRGKAHSKAKAVAILKIEHKRRTDQYYAREREELQPERESVTGNVSRGATFVRRFTAFDYIVRPFRSYVTGETLDRAVPEVQNRRPNTTP